MILLILVIHNKVTMIDLLVDINPLNNKQSGSYKRFNGVLKIIYLF